MSNDTKNAGESTDRPALGTLLRRGMALRCPACGQTKLFAGWIKMNDPCAHCGRIYDRAPGYLLGSIYFNYGVTAVLVTAIYFGCFFSGVMSGKQLLVLLTAMIIVFPLWFLRYARSLWIAFDEQFDPWPNEQERRARDSGKPKA